MAKKCPVTNTYVLYLDCLECDDRECESYKDQDQQGSDKVEQDKD